jgi:prepilin-type N-terminal cleavage/methylation domain-containing protein
MRRRTRVVAGRASFRPGRGVTLIELLVAMVAAGFITYSIGLIYFSTLNIYNRYIWKLPPYDSATAAVQRINKDLRGAMLVSGSQSEALVAILPKRDANRENVLTHDSKGIHLVQGDMIAFYLSDATGSLDATGTCLWEAQKKVGASSFAPKVKIADDVRPDLNPADSSTGLTRPMFKYWPDDVRLWGVEVWVTSVQTVHGQTKAQTAHSEAFLRNL